MADGDSLSPCDMEPHCDVTNPAQNLERQGSLALLAPSRGCLKEFIGSPFERVGCVQHASKQ
jgi:hypothetical protein